MRQVLFGARLFDGVRMLDDAALVIDGQRIAAIVPEAKRPDGAPCRDLGGGVLAPGLIDAQVNGGGGVLFNDIPTVEGIRTIAEAHRRDGTTGLLPTVVTDAPDVLDAALAAGCAAVKTVPGVLGIHIEGPFIDSRRAGAHWPAYIRPLTEPDVARILAAKAGAMLITVAPAAASPQMIGRLSAGGAVVSIGHSDATDLEAFQAFDGGASGVTHLFNAMSPLGHRAPGVVGAALARADVICGLIADGYHVAATAVRVALAAKGSDGIALVSDAMSPVMGGPDEFTLQGRRVQRQRGRLVLDDGTLAGSAITLMDAVRWIVRALGVDLAIALKMATLTPARLLRIDADYGRLAPGFMASLVHISDDFVVRETWVGGESQPGERPKGVSSRFSEARDSD
ncbi:MAG: N-acetylglucosamine-6-phosphate deacetylase [Methylobacteriaceae bacterium]|nr:N-acetylglucosamine-6-phosphate deacetylase [Methylobacteriaceae bacterium]MBV9243997.1 N-acetylglucosamine-6-phosphate deacetylase [Methylobacteriaceae bacterium]